MAARRIVTATLAAIMAACIATPQAAVAAPTKSEKTDSVSIGPGPAGPAPHRMDRFIEQQHGTQDLNFNQIGSESGTPSGLGNQPLSIQPLTVLGPDERIRTTPTTTGISRAIVRIDFIIPGTNQSSMCTGFMISPDTVATAGHCVYNQPTASHIGTEGWIDLANVTVIPALDGTTLPYGFCASPAWAASVHGWTDDGDSNYDYGVIRLNQCYPGYVTGTVGLEPTSGDITGTGTLLRGYHLDKDDGTTMWYTTKPIEISGQYRIEYKHDTYSGSSGAPVITTCPSAPADLCSIGINTNSGTNYNWGIRVTDDVFDNYAMWIADA